MGGGGSQPHPYPPPPPPPPPQARDDTPEVAMGRRLLANLARRLLWA
jgi:hypothetical protein